MALRLSPTEAADKWNRRTAAATQDVLKGVERVTESPGVRAAAAQEMMLTKLIAAIQDGTWAAQLKRMSVDDWKRFMREKGVPRIAQGVASAVGAQGEMYTKLFQAIEATLTEVNQTKRGDLEANITRMTTYARGMSKRKLRRPGA